MKKSMIKGLLTLLLIIEFYPIESNSQTLEDKSMIDKNQLTEISFKISKSLPQETEESSFIDYNSFNEGKVQSNNIEAQGNAIEMINNSKPEQNNEPTKTNNTGSKAINFHDTEAE